MALEFSVLFSYASAATAALFWDSSPIAIPFRVRASSCYMPVCGFASVLV